MVVLCDSYSILSDSRNIYWGFCWDALIDYQTFWGLVDSDCAFDMAGNGMAAVENNRNGLESNCLFPGIPTRCNPDGSIWRGVSGGRDHGGRKHCSRFRCGLPRTKAGNSR